MTATTATTHPRALRVQLTGRATASGTAGSEAARLVLAPVADLAPVDDDGTGGAGGAGGAVATVDGGPDRVRLARQGTGQATLLDTSQAGARRPVLLGDVARDRRTGVIRREVIVDGWRFEVEIEPELRAALRERSRRGGAGADQDGPAEVRAMIPGVVVAVSVAAGDPVEAGQQLLVVEAMKMQNELRSPRGGVVRRVVVGERDTIEVGDLLVVVE